MAEVRKPHAWKPYSDRLGFTKKMINYPQIRDFDGYEMNDSTVYDVAAGIGFVAFLLDLALLPDHPLYESPPPEMYRCWRLGTLTFTGVTRFLWEDQGETRPSVPVGDEPIDFGEFYTLHSQNGKYRIAGDFGSMSIWSGPPKINVFDSPASRRNWRDAFLDQWKRNEWPIWPR